MFKSITDEYKYTDEKITCFKLLIKKDRHYEGPYTEFCYHPKVLYDLGTSISAARSTLWPAKYNIYRGFYTLKNIHELEHYLYYCDELLEEDLYIAECTIPERSRYYTGGYYFNFQPLADGYVSNRIIIDSVMKYSKSNLELLKNLDY